MPINRDVWIIGYVHSMKQRNGGAVVQKILGATMTAMFLTAAPAGAADNSPSPARQRELLNLLFQDCGSCHGLTLRGGLGPALTPEALAGKSPELLRAVILSGRPNTPMPPWKDFMSEPEAAWLVERMKQGVSYAR